MLTRPQVEDYLYALGFTPALPPPINTLTCAGVQVQLLDAPRLVARSAQGGVVYLAVASAIQLEEELTSLLGYERPAYLRRCT